jgi:hypothetical protein
MTAVMESVAMPIVLKTALENWAKNNTQYSALFKSLSKDVLKIVDDAFKEMPRVKPGEYDYWWARNHVRYTKQCKQRELLLLYEIMYHFLTAFSRGQLESSGTRNKKSKAEA